MDGTGTGDLVVATVLPILGFTAVLLVGQRSTTLNGEVDAALRSVALAAGRQ